MNDVKNSPSRGIQSSEKPHSTNRQEPAAELLKACQEGDATARQYLYELYRQPVFRLTNRMVGAQDGGDLTQQVFLMVFQKLDQFAGRSQFRTWLYRLAINECLQHLRRQKRVVHGRLMHDPEDSSANEMARREQHELLEQALGRLEPELRTIFLLKEVEKLSYAELAETLEIPEGTVASRLNRARTQLKTNLIELGWEP